MVLLKEMRMKSLERVLERARRRRTLPPPATRRLLREQWNLTQIEIADVLGITRECVSRYESGHREPRGAVRDKYVDLLERLTKGI